jgi:hypothetical protein
MCKPRLTHLRKVLLHSIALSLELLEAGLVLACKGVVREEGWCMLQGVDD